MQGLYPATLWLKLPPTPAALGNGEGSHTSGRRLVQGCTLSFPPLPPLLTFSPLLLLSLSLRLFLSHCLLAIPRISSASAPPAACAPGIPSLIDSLRL